MRAFINTVIIVYFCLLLSIPSNTFGQTVQSVTILIDASTTLPVGTGLTVDTYNDNFIILAEGIIRIPAHSTWPYTNGWFDPSGLPRLRRLGQYFQDMPFGSLMGTFTVLSSGFYLGDGGTVDTYSGDVGSEFKLGLNMSNGDLANMEGSITVHVIKIPESGVGIFDSYLNSVPSTTKLEQNYPNPFNLSTTINYVVSEAGPVKIRIYDQTGRWIRTLVDNNMIPGEYNVNWDGKNDIGIAVSSGLYYYQFSTATYSDTKKLVLVK